MALGLARFHSFAFFASLLAAFGSGCAASQAPDNGGTTYGSDSGHPSGDTSTTPIEDSGVPTTDTSPAPEDTRPAKDTGSSGADTGSTDFDTGSTDLDTGSTDLDTSVPPTDTSPPPVDTSPVDTGTDTGPTEGGTTGKTCTSDLTCDVLGDGVNACSSDVFSLGTLYPTPVCIGTKCDPGDGTTIVPCDADKGVCLASGTSGICLPECSFADDGAAPTGCAGKDVCNVYGWGSPSGTLAGVGYCFGGCVADSDCTGGNKCQKQSGLCVKSVVTYTKAVGDACVKADAGSATVAAKCECLYATATGKGYCSTFCTVGGATTCGTGFTCSASLPKADPTTGAPLFTKSPVGMAGYCLKNCTTDSDCTAVNGWCQATTDGKVCQPGTKP
jgi:hypothetical protein